MSEAQFKEDICDIGRRIYAKSFAAANEGNISIRLDENRVLVTPTLISKGSMKPDDICTVDMHGNQVAGTRKQTSEVKLHLEIYRQRDDVKSVVHCHPPHATAFAVAREPIPNCVLPEPDIFLGEVPIAPYATTGSAEFAKTILPFVKSTNTIILANHGTVSYESTVERAYWLTEILDAYCRVLILAKQIGHVEFLSDAHGKELLDLRTKWGFVDPRQKMKDADSQVGKYMLFRESWAASKVAARGFSHDGSTPELEPNSLDELAEKVANKVFKMMNP